MNQDYYERNNQRSSAPLKWAIIGMIVIGALAVLDAKADVAITAPIDPILTPITEANMLSRFPVYSQRNSVLKVPLFFMQTTTGQVQACEAVATLVPSTTDVMYRLEQVRCLDLK